MNGAVTWEAVSYFVGLAGIFGGVVWAIHQRIATVKERIEQVRAHTARDLDAFKLIVSERYIRSEALEKIEAKQIASETRMTEAMKGLTARIDTLLARFSPKDSAD